MTFSCVVIETTLEVKAEAEVEALKDIKTRCHMIKVEWLNQISRKSMLLNIFKLTQIMLLYLFRFKT
jgi:hypothetical protein